MAMYKNWLYFGTPDGHLVSLDATTGKERWHKEVGSVKSNYYVSAAPVVVKDHLIVGSERRCARCASLDRVAQS